VLAPGAHFGARRRAATANGPAIAFADGFAVNVLHGTPVPEWVLSGPAVDLKGPGQADPGDQATGPLAADSARH
jgi:hypothetical protein